jgi:hypothetical protein
MRLETFEPRRKLFNGLERHSPGLIHSRVEHCDELRRKLRSIADWASFILTIVVLVRLIHLDRSLVLAVQLAQT